MAGEELEAQIRDTMRAAFSQSLHEICAKETLEAKDVDWLVLLMTEVKDKMQNLTPNRGDIRASIESSIDVDLIRQMLTHNACEAGDFRDLVRFVFCHLKKVCAPSQDAQVEEATSKILVCDNFKEAFPVFIIESNQIMDDIRKLAAEFYKKNHDQS